MRFVTDLSRGILGKPDSRDLWEEIVDHIPDEVFLKPNVKILCVAAGHGTEADVIVARMRRLGCSIDDIKDSIYLLDKYSVFVNEAIRKGYVHVIKADFLDWTSNMKFDVVIGNPPYQKGNQGIWKNFVKKSVSILKNNGFFSFVTPNSWTNGSHPQTEKNIFNWYMQKFNCVVINTNVNCHFKGIGKNISYWTLIKQPYQKKTKVIDKDGKSTIIDISKYPFFINNFSFISLDIFEKVVNYGIFYSEFVENDAFYTRCYSFPKAKHISYKSKGYKFDHIEENFPSSKIRLNLDCSNLSLEQVQSIHSQFSSKLFRFLWDIYGATDAGSFGWILRNMPKLPNNKIYSDNDIYNFFNLTQEEIDYIESNVK